MRTRLDHLVTSALQHGSAVPAFTCYDFTTAMAVVAAAEGAGRGAILRASQGSATVAIITTSGLLAASVADGGFSPIQTALILVAIGFGAFGLSHVNDSGFWIVTRYLGLSVADGLKTWTVLTTILGLAGFALTFLVWVLVGGLGV